MSTITKSAHPKALWPGVRKMWGEEYAKHPKYHSMIFDMSGSKQAYEEDVELTGFGLASVKPEGSAVTYDSHEQQNVTRYTHVTYGIGCIVTEEELDDNLYEDRAFKRTKMLAFSMNTTIEQVAANVLNRGFNSSYPGGDGKELFATDHPVVGGTQSNELAVAADLSEAALEDILIDIRNAKNNRGLQVSIMGEKLIIPPALEFEAHRILNSTLRVGTADNDVNAIKAMGMLPGGVICNPYLTDADAWFIKTNAPTGLTGFMRKAPTLTQDNDFDTSNAKMKSVARFVFGHTDFRGAYGSPGA